MRVTVSVLFAAAALLLGGCGSEDGVTAPAGGATDGAGASSFALASASFESGTAIPDVYACEDEGGSDISPQLSWTNTPGGTAAYAVVMDDETPPCGKGDGACMHWSVFNIPADKMSLAEGEDVGAITGIALGRNYTGSDGYAGPCPPGPHVYKISVYALAEGAPIVKSGSAFTRSSFESEYAAYILASDTIEASFTP